MIKRLSLLCLLLIVQVYSTIFDRVAHPTVAKMSATPSSITDGNEPITITWSGIGDVTDNDIIVLIHSTSGQTSPLTKGDDVKVLGFYKAIEHPSNTISVRLYHPRENAFYFEYHRVNGNKATYLAGSNSVTAFNQFDAHQFHIAMTHHASEMRVSFTTSAEWYVPLYVQYSREKFSTLVSSFGIDLSQVGKDESAYISKSQSDIFWNYHGKITTKSGSITVVRQRAAPQDATYVFSQMKNEPATLKSKWIEPGYMRSAVLLDLAPSTRYYYRVVDRNNKIMSKEFSFVSAPGVGKDIPVSFFVFGDLGNGYPYYNEIDTQPPAAETVRNIEAIIAERKRLHRDSSSMMLHLGDISYAQGNAYMWETFMQQMEPLASEIPHMVTIGNHEYCYPSQEYKPDWGNYANDSGGEGGHPFYARYAMPRDYATYPYPPTNQTIDDLASVNLDWNKIMSMPKDHNIERNIAYSFDYGCVHIIVFSAEHPFTVGTKQYDFIASDLAKVDRTVTPWLILASHRPPYSTSVGMSLRPDYKTRHTYDSMIRETYEPLMVKHKVDLGLWAHVHVYERTCKMNNFQCGDDNGDLPTHVVLGMSGHIYNQEWEGWAPKKLNKGRWHHDQPDWLTFRTMNYGFVEIHANSTHLTSTFYGNKRMTVHDQFTLEKK